ncbi:MAG: D-alanyl-D-alanine carboxypeptidase [Solirubrobacterales bacterium]|nr:D-alanyl-D-alanine carboxypeptidase [Solirubrobacterales bacterium]
MATLAVLFAAAPAAAQKQQEGPKVDAAAWLLIDLRDGHRLAAHKPSSQRSIASTTKLMTAYLAMRDLSMKEKLKVPAYSPAPAESVAGLTKGEKLTVHDLITAMMLPSANDAAFTVAVGVAGSEGAFVGEMNHAAKDLGLDDTSYSNPIGLDDVGNYSSAEDLASLSSVLLEDKRFRHIVSEPEATLKSGSMPRRVVTRNTLLLSDPTVDGVKTGHTIDAGYVLVASAKRKGVPLLSIVLGAPSESERDAASEELLDYGYSLYREREPFADGEELASADVRYRDESLGLVADGTVGARIRADQEFDTRVNAPAEVEGPIEVGEKLGHATVLLDGKRVGRVPLVAAEDVAAPSIIDKAGGARAVAAIVFGLIVILLVAAWALRRRGERRHKGRSAEERMRSLEERDRRRNSIGGEG